MRKPRLIAAWLVLWLVVGLFAWLSLNLKFDPDAVPSPAPEYPPTPAQSGASNGLATGSPVPSAAEAVPSDPVVTDGPSEETPKVTPGPTPMPTVRSIKLRGQAVWLNARKGHAATPWGYWRMKPVAVHVCLVSHPKRCVDSFVTGYCACNVGSDDPRIIDLPRVDFAKLAKPSIGKIVVTLERRK